MAKRKSISQKTRFEIFKRDLFQCQYCGSKAPDVILEIDHIIPVAKGGDNSLENLITACKDCNRGKRDKKISDLSEAERSRKQLEELQEKQNIVKMIFQWKQSLRDQEYSSVNRLNDILEEETGYMFNDNYASTLKKSIKKYGLDIVIDALYTAIDQYYDPRDGKDKDSVELILDKWKGVAYNLFLSSNDPKKSSITYIKNTLKRNIRYLDERKFYAIFPKWYDLDYRDEFLYEAKNSKNFEDFICKLDGIAKREGI